jgi:putative PIN family toxin of toxin-antitoxin system
VTRVTLDSNIYISALVFGGKPMRVLEMATEGAIRVGISDAILAEVRRVLLTKFGWSAERVAAAVETIGSITERTAPTETIEIVKTDPDDNRVVECATAAGSEFIVSGDADLLALGGFGGITVVTAAKFLAQFDDQGR